VLIIRLAFRNIFRQRRRSLLTALSMTGGFVLVTFSFSLLEGSWGNAVDIFTLDHTGHVQIHKDDYHRRPKIHKTIDNTEDVSAYLNGNGKVAGYAPRVFAPGLAYAGNQSSPVQVMGVDPILEPQTSRLKQKVTDGHYFDSSPDGDGYVGVMIGASVARTLKIGVGDELIIISQGADGSIANDIFVIRAIIGNKTSYDRLGVYVPLAAAQEFLSLGNRVHEIALLLHDGDDNQDIAAAIQRDLDSLTVSPWQVVEETFFKTMQSDRQGNYFAMGIIILIVFIGVLNTVLMSVLERTREFGVIRAIGSRPFEVVKLIFLESIMMAVLSILIGAVLSLPILAFLVNIGFELPEPIEMSGISFQDLTGRVNSFVLTAPALMILGFAALVSIPPAIRAARITPREALGSH
jgi:putative ABC transport system permease protein